MAQCRCLASSASPHWASSTPLRSASPIGAVFRLASGIESLAPDYSLYPELGDRAIGFLTRGCPQHCPFCLVPIKEGPPRLVCDLDTLLQGRKKLILLDDNLLSYPGALGLLDEIARHDVAVNFNQTLDLRRLTPDSAALLRQIRCSNSTFTRHNYHFSLNDARQLQGLRESYTLLQTKGRDNVEFVCMYGFNTSLAEDVERFRFLRSLPGAYVFVQRYRPVPGGLPPNLSRLFDQRADLLLDELVRIIFPQNMKSMETYYRWIALQYAAQAGRIHHCLVETLFRFNSRPQMGGFLHRLNELAQKASSGSVGELVLTRESGTPYAVRSIDEAQRIPGASRCAPGKWRKGRGTPDSSGSAPRMQPGRIWPK